jgi:hypothetical protein
MLPHVYCESAVKYLLLYLEVHNFFATVMLIILILVLNIVHCICKFNFFATNICWEITWTAPSSKMLWKWLVNYRPTFIHSIKVQYLIWLCYQQYDLYYNLPTHDIWCKINGQIFPYTVYKTAVKSLITFGFSFHEAAWFIYVYMYYVSIKNIYYTIHMQTNTNRPNSKASFLFFWVRSTINILLCQTHPLFLWHIHFYTCTNKTVFTLLD